MWEEEHAKDHSSYGPTQIKQLQKRESRKQFAGPPNKTVSYSG